MWGGARPWCWPRPPFPRRFVGPGAYPNLTKPLCRSHPGGGLLGHLNTPPPPFLFFLLNPLSVPIRGVRPPAPPPWEGRVPAAPTLQPRGHTTDLGPPPPPQHFFCLFFFFFFNYSYLYCRFVMPQDGGAPGPPRGPLEITRVLLESAVSPPLCFFGGGGRAAGRGHGHGVWGGPAATSSLPGDKEVILGGGVPMGTLKAATAPPTPHPLPNKAPARLELHILRALLAVPRAGRGRGAWGGLGSWGSPPPSALASVDLP